MSRFVYTISPDEFQITLRSIIEEPNEIICDKLEPAIRESLKLAKKICKEYAPVNPNVKLSKGPYRSGFSMKVKRVSKNKVYGVVKNKKYPGLVHLLEKGHNTLAGHRVNGKTHVMFAKKLAAKDLEARAKQILKDSIHG